MRKNKPKTSSSSRKSLPPAVAKRSVPPPAPRKTLPPAPRKSVPPAPRKSVPPGGRKGGEAGRKSVIPPAPKVPRRFGLRGAAPWALRHAERQAAEAARRNREPPKPGSARATLRTPQQADRIKAAIGELHGLIQKLRALQKNINESAFELGEILGGIERAKLYEAKGYSSIETFAERELGMGKGLAGKLVRIPSIFQPAAARMLKLDALSRALDAIDQSGQTAAARAAKLPLKPPK
jgi:hypothetical protein